MPPKKPAADSVKEENPGARRDDVYVFPAGVLAMRKLPHPSTTVMVKEALKELDSRRGCSSQAIQRYIKEEYPSVDAVRLKHFVRRALNKGLESGDLVRPANSSVTTGAMGKFRLAPKLKKPKPKSENVDPNEQKEPEKKDEAKKPPKRGAKKKEASKESKPQEASKPPKRSQEDKKAGTSKVVPVKKPKGRKTAATGSVEEPAAAAKPKAAKSERAGNAAQRKMAKTGSDAPAAKTTGKRGKKAAE